MMTYKQQLVMLNLFQHLFPEKYFNGRFRNNPPQADGMTVTPTTEGLL